MKREENKYNDCISRQAVLESLETDYSLIMYDGYGNLTFAGKRIIEAIKRAPSVEPIKNKGEWIAVSDRLPDAADTYIVTIEYKGDFIGVDAAEFVFTGDGYIDGKWNTWNDWKEGPDIFYHVSAWMPLPEAYKEEMEDAEMDDVENSLRLCRDNYKAQMESLGYDASGNPLD